MRRSPGQPQSRTRSVILGTAGHIDHGKTTLVQALTGVDTDRLPEEKARGITIDLGYAALDLDGPQGEQFSVSVIDVPGHHAFVRNMLAGTGGIDAVLLVVAADEGPRAQTLEHLQICTLLGVRSGVVVLTKRDVVSDTRLAEVKAEVEDLVRATFLERAPVVAVSARTGEGLPALRAAVSAVLAHLPARSADQVPRLPIDRAFSVRGFGTVVTGTLQAGAITAGTTMVLEPGTTEVRVRGVQIHGQAVLSADAPNRVALNLVGVEVEQALRGDTVTLPNTLRPVSTVDAEVDLLPDEQPLRHRQKIRVHAFAAETIATVLTFPDTEALAPGQTGAAQHQILRLRLARPMLLLPGDRFVLRQPSPAKTVAGGRVLDAAPLPRLRRAATLQWLQTLRSIAEPAAFTLRIGRRGSFGLPMRDLIAETGWTRSSLQRWVKPLVAAGQMLEADREERFWTREALEPVSARVRAELERSPAGVSLSSLRSGLRLPGAVAESVIGLALAHLRQHAITVRGDIVVLGQETRPSPAQAALSGTAIRVEAIYRTAGLASPLVQEVGEQLRLGAPELRSAVTALLRGGQLIRLGSDALLVHQEAIMRLREELRKRRGQTLDVGQFKATTGLTRKHAIPLLEYLDGARVTRNTGGQRTIL